MVVDMMICFAIIHFVYHKDRDLFAAVQDYRERMYEIVDLSDEIITLSRLL